MLNKSHLLINIAVMLTVCFIPLNGISQQYFSIQGGIGLGKVQFYENYHPVYLSGSGKEDLKFCASWNILLRSTWPLSEKFDVAISASHLTISGRKGAVRPSWTNPSEENFTQGFIHIIPSFSYNPTTNFTFTSGIRLGIANPFDSGNAEESSNSFLNSDIGITTQFMFKLNKKINLGFDWIEGLTFYDYFEKQNSSPYYTFFKYRTFLIICQYDLLSKKRN